MLGALDGATELDGGWYVVPPPVMAGGMGADAPDPPDAPDAAPADAISKYPATAAVPIANIVIVLFMYPSALVPAARAVFHQEYCSA